MPDELFLSGGGEYHKQGEYFFNWYAQASWVLRIRADNTMRLLAGENIDPHKCLFIDPAIPQLESHLGEMSQPEWNDTGGKLRIDKQPHIDGQAKPSSPDTYDSVVMAFSTDFRYHSLSRLMNSFLY